MSDKDDPGRRFRVFLCHSAEDKPVVRIVYRRLKSAGFSPWLDEEDLIPGQDWREAISAAMRTCAVVIVCVSKSSVTKEGFVQKEIRFALDLADEKPPETIFIIPARLGPDAKIPPRLVQWHWVDLFSESGYDKLIAALKVRSATHQHCEAKEPDSKN